MKNGKWIYCETLGYLCCVPSVYWLSDNSKSIKDIVAHLTERAKEFTEITGLQDVKTDMSRTSSWAKDNRYFYASCEKEQIPKELKVTFLGKWNLWKFLE